MQEGHKTALAFLGIFIFLGLAIFFQADISGYLDEDIVEENPETPVNQNRTNGSGTVQASTEHTDTFQGELGSEYVFDIETVDIERQDSRNGRLYYRSQLNFELTEFGEQVLQASSNEEVRNLVRERFEKYPEREGFEQDLINDVEAVNDNRIEDIPVEALTGNLESIEKSGNSDVQVVVSFEQGERPQIKWGSFSTVWSMEVTAQSVSLDGVFSTSDQGVIQTSSDGVVQAASLDTVIDDFEDGGLTEYSKYSSSGSVGTSSASSYEGTYSTKMNLDGNANGGSWGTALSTEGGGLNYYPQAGDTFEFWMNTASLPDYGSGTNYRIGVMFGASATNSNYWVGLDESENFALIKDKYTDAGITGGTILTETPSTYAIGDWRRVKVEWRTDGTIISTLYNSSGSQAAQITATDSTYSSGGIGVTSATYGSGTAYPATSYIDKIKNVTQN